MGNEEWGMGKEAKMGARRPWADDDSAQRLTACVATIGRVVDAIERSTIIAKSIAAPLRHAPRESRTRAAEYIEGP
jgi:hypothetical protein